MCLVKVLTRTPCRGICLVSISVGRRASGSTSSAPTAADVTSSSLLRPNHRACQVTGIPDAAFINSLHVRSRPRDALFCYSAQAALCRLALALTLAFATWARCWLGSIRGADENEAKLGCGFCGTIES
jgi:hypothetical protein